MPKYIGVNNVAREVVRQYVGVNNAAREVKIEYAGVNNAAREVFSTRDLSKNMWRVMSLTPVGSNTSSAVKTEGNTFNSLYTNWIYSKSSAISVTLQSSIKFLKGDTFRITFTSEVDLNEDNPKFNDAYGQSCSLSVINVSNSSNSASVQLRSGIEPVESADFTLTQDGYLEVHISLEGCGENYISSNVDIEINGITL